MPLTDQETEMTNAGQDPVPRDPPAPPGSDLEALVDDLGTGPDAGSTESRAPDAEPPDA